jgi:hypothetical protein
MQTFQQFINCDIEPLRDTHQCVEAWQRFPVSRKPMPVRLSPDSMSQLLLAYMFLHAQFFDSACQGVQGPG